MKAGLRAEVHHNGPRSRYEITVDGRVVGFAEYGTHGDTVVFPHTEIEPSMLGVSAHLIGLATRAWLEPVTGAVPAIWGRPAGLVPLLDTLSARR